MLGGKPGRPRLAHRVVTSLQSTAITVFLGAAVGTVLLGGGGRVAMWIFALATARSAGFTVDGTVSVILSGTIAGAVGGLVLVLVGRFLPARAWRRGIAFAGLCYALAIPGFRPPRPLVFALFAPWFLGFGVALVFLDRRFGQVARTPNSGP